MGFLKKKVDNELLKALIQLNEADYEKASPEMKKLYECLVDAHNSVEDIFKKNLSSYKIQYFAHIVIRLVYRKFSMIHFWKNTQHTSL